MFALTVLKYVFIIEKKLIFLTYHFIVPQYSQIILIILFNKNTIKK